MVCEVPTTHFLSLGLHPGTQKGNACCQLRVQSGPVRAVFCSGHGTGRDRTIRLRITSNKHVSLSVHIKIARVLGHQI